jgi:membrane protease subunit HflC
MPRSIIGVIAVLFIGLITLFQSAFIVDEREQALIFQLGQLKGVREDAGLHFKIPFLQQIEMLEKRIMSMDNPPTEALEVDQRRLLVDSFTRFRIVDPLKRFQAAQDDRLANSLLSNAVNSAVKEVIAKETMQAVVSGQRAELMERIREIADTKVQEYGMAVVDVRLKRVDLPEQNSQAIFARMETERQREAAEERAIGQRDAIKIKADADRQVAVLQANAERQAQIIRGEADGLAAKIFADAYGKDKEFFEFYRTMQAYRKSLGKDDTTLVLSPDSEFFKLFINDGGK